MVRLIEECSFLLPQDYHLATNEMTLFDVKLSIKFFTTFNFFVNPVLFLSLFGHAMSNFLRRERFGDLKLMGNRVLHWNTHEKDWVKEDMYCIVSIK